MTTFQQDQRPSYAASLILCFSLYTNLNFLLKTSKPERAITSPLLFKPQKDTSDEIPNTTTEIVESQADLVTAEANQTNKRVQRPQIGCLHGIRFTSFFFILLYHVFTEAQVPSTNLVQIIVGERQFMRQLITNASLWVDTFFVLSGLVSAHSLLYSSASEQSMWSILRDHPKRVFHRYLRLTPSVAGVLSLSILIEVLGSGPLWYKYVELSKSTCHRNWWTIFLYVNNIFKLNQPDQLPREVSKQSSGRIWVVIVCVPVPWLSLVFGSGHAILRNFPPFNCSSHEEQQKVTLFDVATKANNIRPGW